MDYCINGYIDGNYIQIPHITMYQRVVEIFDFCIVTDNENGKIILCKDRFKSSGLIIYKEFNSGDSTKNSLVSIESSTSIDTMIKSADENFICHETEASFRKDTPKEIKALQDKINDTFKNSRCVSVIVNAHKSLFEGK